MRNRRAFRPSAVEDLEPRLALSTVPAVVHTVERLAAQSTGKQIAITVVNHTGGSVRLTHNSGKDPMILLENPISATLLGIAALALIAPFAMKGLNRFKASED